MTTSMERIQKAKQDIFTYLKYNTSTRACRACGTKVRLLSGRNDCDPCAYRARSANGAAG